MASEKRKEQEELSRVDGDEPTHGTVRIYRVNGLR